MPKLLSLFIFFTLCLTAVAGESTSCKVTVRVKDPYGEPVIGAKVEIGNQLRFTDDKGNALFEAVERKQSILLSISSELPIYLSKQTTIFLKERLEIQDFILNWNTTHWDSVLSSLHSEEILARQTLIDSTDYSSYVDCDDNSGTHQFIDAAFPGGVTFMQYYISASVVYPEISVEMEEQGKVYLSFIIETDGQISEVAVQKGISRDLDREAKRCVSEMPRWVPGYCNGTPVRTRAFLPVVFRLE